MIRIDRVSEESQLINIGPSHPAMQRPFRSLWRLKGKVLASTGRGTSTGVSETAENKSYPR